MFKNCLVKIIKYRQEQLKEIKRNGDRYHISRLEESVLFQ